VRQQNSGAVEDFSSLYSAVYLRIQKWKNYWNRFTFAKVIVKIKVAPFFMAHGVVASPLHSQVAYSFRYSGPQLVRTRPGSVIPIPRYFQIPIPTQL